MNLRINLVICTLIVCPFLKAQAQEMPISALPVYHNGGFAGEAGAPRINTYHEVTSGNYYNGLSSYLSYDNFFKKLRSGIAVTGGLLGYNEGTPTTYSSLAISPKFSFKGKCTVAPFIDLSYRHARFSYPLLSTHGPQPVPKMFYYNYSTSKIGLLINSSKAYLGFTAQVYENTESDYFPFEHQRFLRSMRYEIQAGYTYQPTPESDWSFTPQLAIAYKRYVDQDSIAPFSKYHVLSLVDLNLIFRYKKFISGINSNGLVVGYQTNRLKLQLTNLYRGSGNGLFGNYWRGNVNVQGEIFRPGFETYTASLSLRYILKKPGGPKMPGF